MANNQLSINKIVSIFRDLAVRHKQIQDFGYGPTYNIDSRSEPMLFAYLWLDDIGSVIESTDAGYKSIYYTFDLYCMDKINKGDSNYDETVSDTNTILNQIIAEMAQHKYYRDMGLNLNGNITMEPVTEATNDNVNGWKATMTLKMPYRLVPCNIPIEPITGYTVSLNSNITEYRLVGATGPQGATGPAGEPGATGATGAGANVTADNGLTKTGDNIQLGGVLTENTNISGDWQLYLNPKTITIDTNIGDLNLYANTGDVNVSSTGDTSIAADGSLYFTTYTGATLYADSGRIDLIASAGAIHLTSDTVLITDNISNKGAEYAGDYSSNFTDESLITKRYLTNYVATASSSGTTPSIAQVVAVGNTLNNGQLIQGNDTSTYFQLDNGFYTEYSSGPNSGSIFIERTIDLVSSGTVSLDGTVVNVNDSKVINLATASNPLDSVNYIQLDNSVRSDFGCGVDGNSGTIVAGLVGYKTMPNSGVITGWDIIASPTGSVTFDVWKTSANSAPTVLNSIFGPTLSNSEYSSGSVSFTFSTGDKFGFNIVTASTITSVNLSIKIKKTY